MSGALTEHLNPILVKEVRQALRSRYFRILFWLTLSATTIIGLLVIANRAPEPGQTEVAGRAFFMVIFLCLSVAVHGFTPFSAFLSTSAEWDENTHDLLVLSNLRPRQIVLGKLLSALVQALLYYSTFGPFLVFAFLLNGIDLLTIGVLLGCSVAFCTALTLIGIALASLAHGKALRGLLMAAFGGGLVMGWIWSGFAAAEMIESPQMLYSREGRLVLLSFLILAFLMGALFGGVAAGRFAHEEENRSTWLRVASLAIVCLATAWGALVFLWLGEHEALYGVQVVAALVLFLLWLSFLTEPETLGRRVSKQVPRTSLLALLSAPFLPGGGLGVLLFLVHALVALLGASIALWLGRPTSPQAREVLAEIAVLYGYGFLFVGLPTAFARFVKSRSGRVRLRVCVLLGTPLALLLPALFGLLVGHKEWMELKHPLNPAWVMVQLGRSSPASSLANALVLLASGVVLTLILNTRRVLAGVSGVLAASRARRRPALRSARPHGARG